MALTVCFVGMSGLAALASSTTNGFLTPSMDTVQASPTVRLDLHPPDWQDGFIPLGRDGFNPGYAEWFTFPEGDLVYRIDWQAQVLSAYRIQYDCDGTLCITQRSLYGGGTFDLLQWNEGPQTWTPLYSGTVGGGYFRLDCVGVDCDWGARLATSGLWLDTGEVGTVIYTDSGDTDGPSYSRLLGMATPEPSTLLLLGIGALGLVGRLRRSLDR